MIVHNWFDFINKDNKTRLQYTMREKHDYANCILKTFKIQLDTDMKDSIRRKRKHASSTQSNLMPTQKKRRIS